jgi:flavin-dependent dehydrogenase
VAALPRRLDRQDSCDVLIVGGGPGGSSCAWKLRGSGLDVLILDRSEFPRDKVCAGWITPQIVEELELVPEDYARDCVLQPIRGFRVSRMGGVESAVDYGEVVSFGIRRCEFDQFLLERCGARLRLGEPAKTFRREGSAWMVNESIEARMLVGAGGHFCPVARHLSGAARDPEPVVAAQEVEFELDDRQRDACPVDPALPELFFSEDLKGYAWLVRKGRFINIGLGRQDSHDVSGHVERFVEFARKSGKLPSGALQKFRGHAYLLYGRATRPMLGDGVVLVGDSAGLAYARSGEGIRPAIESGLLAARAILGAGGRYGPEALADYERDMTARFGERGGRGRELTDLVPERWRPWLAKRVLANAWFARHVLLGRWFLRRFEPSLLLD